MQHLPLMPVLLGPSSTCAHAIGGYGRKYLRRCMRVCDGCTRLCFLIRPVVVLCVWFHVHAVWCVGERAWARHLTVPPSAMSRFTTDELAHMHLMCTLLVAL